jgi:hypothetical protein
MEKYYHEVLASTRRKESSFKHFKPAFKDSRPASRNQQVDNPNIRRLFRLGSADPRSAQDRTPVRRPPTRDKSPIRPVTANSSVHGSYSKRAVRPQKTEKHTAVDVQTSLKKAAIGLEGSSPQKLMPKKSAEVNRLESASPSKVDSNTRDKLEAAKKLDRTLRETEPQQGLEDAIIRVQGGGDSRPWRYQTERSPAALVEDSAAAHPTRSQAAPYIECVLKDDDVPMIAETDHYTRRCLCHLCTCGEHECPCKPYSQLSARAAFKTIYKKDYRRKFVTYSEARKSLEVYRSNSLPMDFTTTNQLEFRPFRVEPVDPENDDSAQGRFPGRQSADSVGASQAHNRLAGQTLGDHEGPQSNYRSVARASDEPFLAEIPQPYIKFTGRSQYNREYANWGPNYVEHAKHHYPPYLGKDLRLDVRTTYSAEFSGKQRQRKEENEPGSSALTNTPGIISQSTQFYGDTVAKTSFAPAPQGQQKLSTYSYAIKPQYAPSECSSNHFTTTYTSDFTAKGPKKAWPKKPQQLL